MHAGIDCNLPAKVIFKFLILAALWRIVTKQLGEALCQIWSQRNGLEDYDLLAVLLLAFPP